MLTNLMGESKVDLSIQRLRAFEPEEGYWLAYSGGKDSTVLLELARMSGVKFDTHYSITTVDPPELVRFVIRQFDSVIYHMPDGTQKIYRSVDGKLRKADSATGNVIYFEIPKKSMRQLIAERKMPPTRVVRYCCAELKEAYGDGRITVTGVRWAESVNRKLNHGIVTMASKSKHVKAITQANGADFTQSHKGGVVLNYDDAATRRTVEQCYRTSKTLLNPIIDWTEDDVWQFIRERNLPYCSLYDEGWHRLGCIGCPMGNTPQREKEFQRWPQYRAMYLKAFEAMLKDREAAGLPNVRWADGEAVMDWWIYGYKDELPEELMGNE